MSGRRRDLVVTGALWVVLVIVGVLVVRRVDLLPALRSEEGAEVDLAFNTLLLYSIPVFAFVLAVLLYSVVRWRVDEPETGDQIRDVPAFSWGWFLVSTALAGLIFVTPGLTGFFALQSAATEEPDLEVRLTGVQWHWDVEYPEAGVALEAPREILLPADRRVRFELTSADVIHAFWVPAFRLKQDAIPGETTELIVTPTEVSSYDADPNVRLQCAELCGTGHARMYVPVRVVEPAEFEAWLTGAAMGMGGDGMDMGSDGMDMGGNAGHDEG